jgi:hypothetical protein
LRTKQLSPISSHLIDSAAAKSTTLPDASPFYAISPLPFASSSPPAGSRSCSGRLDPQVLGRGLSESVAWRCLRVFTWPLNGMGQAGRANEQLLPVPPDALGCPYSADLPDATLAPQYQRSSKRAHAPPMGRSLGLLHL